MAQIEEVVIYGSNKWSDLKPLEMSDEDLVQVKWLKYYKDTYEKNQIVLHHTVSGPGIKGDLRTWENYKSHIATCVIIGRDGKINQLFSSKYWGYHLGCGKPMLDKMSIAVELDNWGQLEERDGKLYTVYNSVVDVPTVHYPEGFRGEQIFEAYPEAQLRSLGELLLLWNKNYKIPLSYNEDMWDVSKRALNGDPGVWAHVSYRPWPSKHNKWDVHPDPNLRSMLRTISGLAEYKG
jgi:N-acetylmuramoyl-L-alanine amidase